MLTRTASTFFLVATILGGTYYVAASPGGPLRLQTLIDSSDCVAVAELKNISSAGEDVAQINGNEVRGERHNAQLETHRTIKGLCPATATVTFFIPDRFMGYPGIGSGLQLVFLTRADGRYEFANRRYPSLPACPGQSPAVESNLDPVEQVAIELGCVVASPATDKAQKWRALSVSYAIPPSDSFSSALQSAVKSTSDLDLQYRIQMELVRRNDIAATNTVVALLRTGTLTEPVESEFLRAIAIGVRNPKAISSLEPLLSSTDATVRRAAMEALWHIGDAAADRLLIVGLRDSDQEVRYYAIRALADIHHQPGWGPSVGLFEKDEQLFINHWLDWGKINISPPN